LDFAASELALFAATLLAAGLVAGLLAGLLGVGGGIVVVPVLYHGFSRLGLDPSVRMHVAVATSLATVAVTAFRSARSHHQRGAVDTQLLSGWIPAVALGSALGTAVVAAMGGRALTGVFGAIALLVALHMAFGRESWRIAEAPPTGPAGWPLAGAVGFVSVMMGLGGGTVGVPTLTLLGVAMRRALAGIGVPGRPPGSIGYLNLFGFALIVPTTWLSAPVGARFAHAVSQQALRRGFAFFLGLAALRMLLDLR
jgi:uncharacterized protein